jgi:monofunctional biosynthetic peptidoglycan transglycosylase
MVRAIEAKAARRRSAKVRKPGSKWRRWVKWALIAVVGIGLLYHAWILFLVVRYRTVNPGSTALMNQRISEAKSRGEPPKRIQTWVPYERISPNLVRAVLAGEDSRFFDHEGFDWEEMRKALEKDWNEGKFSRGASTISQQLAKNLFLSTSKNPLRKLHEALITWEMEKILGKRRILELYLNVIEWGNGIYGAEAAARNYFNTSASSLSQDQAAFLSAIIPGPIGALNPSTHRRRVERRKNLIARLMRHVVVPKDLD